MFRRRKVERRKEARRRAEVMEKVMVVMVAKDRAEMAPGLCLLGKQGRSESGQMMLSARLLRGWRKDQPWWRSQRKLIRPGLVPVHLPREFQLGQLRRFKVNF